MTTSKQRPCGCTVRVGSQHLVRAQSQCRQSHEPTALMTCPQGPHPTNPSSTQHAHGRHAIGMCTAPHRDARCGSHGPCAGHQRLDDCWVPFRGSVEGRRWCPMVRAALPTHVYHSPAGLRGRGGAGPPWGPWAGVGKSGCSAGRFKQSHWSPNGRFRCPDHSRYGPPGASHGAHAASWCL